MGESRDRHANLLNASRQVNRQVKREYLSRGRVCAETMEAMMTALDRYGPGGCDTPDDPEIDMAPRPHGHLWMRPEVKAGVDRPPVVRVTGGSPAAILHAQDVVVEVDFCRGEGCCGEDLARTCTALYRGGDLVGVRDPWLEAIAEWIAACDAG